MKRTVLVSIASIAMFLSSQVMAGDNGGGSIQCQSSSGRTKISGMAGTKHNGYGSAELTVEIDGKKLTMGRDQVVSRNGRDAVDAVVFSKAAKVYTVKLLETIDYDQGYSDVSENLELLAIPTTVKETQKDVLEFQAQLKTLDPRVNQKDTVDGRVIQFDKTITVNCILDVSL